MDSNPLVAIIVGLVTASSIYVWKSDEFNKSQKTFILFCIVFPPIQWIMILLAKYYNKLAYKKSKEFKKEVLNYNEEKKIDNSKTTLQELKDSGIITEEEYKTKVEKIDGQKTELAILNSKEYNQLKSLLDSNILTKEEFESKVEILKHSNIKSEILEKVLPPTFNPVEFDSLESENKSSTVKTYFLSFLALIALYLLIYLFINSNNYSNENIDSQPTAIDSTYINNSYQNTTYVEPLKIKKFVYVVMKIEKPSLDVYEPKGFINSVGFYETLDPMYSINYEKETYSTDIIEVNDYNIDEKYKVLDDAKNKMYSQLKFVDDAFSTNLWVKCKDDSKKEEFKGIRSKITDSQIFDFDSYSEASIHKQDNLDINPKQ
ncbi:SHOCT domain-containing protein [Flavobacterium sp. ZB4P23]|uniref:SHOCT domain-containing protein n=1 Tax=Flavobacterium sp. ZB4P23 TaxID=2497484 RepID=UPI000F84A30C|nr:SHOCT domain-containing protein [Flavobacterium sp. ZB4P23]RTY83381.1 SHOCT domain-containing protein [Flavobacterium sp. ZB4P23]